MSYLKGQILSVCLAPAQNPTQSLLHPLDSLRGLNFLQLFSLLLAPGQPLSKSLVGKGSKWVQAFQQRVEQVEHRTRSTLRTHIGLAPKGSVWMEEGTLSISNSRPVGDAKVKSKACSSSSSSVPCSLPHSERESLRTLPSRSSSNKRKALFLINFEGLAPTQVAASGLNTSKVTHSSSPRFLLNQSMVCEERMLDVPGHIRPLVIYTWTTGSLLYEMTARC